MSEPIQITGCHWCGKSISYGEDGEGYLDHMAECAAFKAECERLKEEYGPRIEAALAKQGLKVGGWGSVYE